MGGTAKSASALVLMLLLLEGGFAGGTGAELLGSEELPVLWGFVAPGDGLEFSRSIDAYFAALALESGLYIDPVLFESQSSLIASVEAGTLHVVVLPVITYLVARSQGLVEPGMIAELSSPPEGVAAVTRADFPELAELSADALSFARHDPIATRGWLTLRIVLAAHGVRRIDDSSITDVGSYDEALETVGRGEALITALPLSVWDSSVERPTDVALFSVVEGVPGDGVHFAAGLEQRVQEGIIRALSEKPESGLGFLGEAYGWDSLRRAHEDDFDEFLLILESVGLRPRLLP